MAALPPKSHYPNHLTIKLTDAQAQQIAQLVHRSLREFGKASSLWTLDLLVEVS